MAAIGAGLPGALGPVGTDTTLDLATWNMEYFPMAGATTINRDAQVMQATRVDVWAVEEISSVAGFDSLLARLPDYRGVLSPDVYSDGTYQKTGILYRRGVVDLKSVGAIFTGDDFNWPRPPIEAELTAHIAGVDYTFRLIVMHLKAGTTPGDLQRRRGATHELYTYLQARLSSTPGTVYLVAGDWNSLLTDPAASSSFPDFLADSQEYRFLDQPLATRSDLYSHPPTGRHLDHILVNRAGCPGFSHASVTTLQLDTVIPDYYAQVSDHRPVVVETSLAR